MSSDRPVFDTSELCARIRQRDPRAEAELIERFLPRVRAMVAVRTNDPDAVDDLGQSIMLAALCSLRAAPPRNPELLASFLFGIARNYVSDYFRMRGRRRSEDLSAAESIPFAAERARENEMIADARREIAKLDSADRQVLELTVGEGLESNEIAERLRISPAAVRQRKSRALKRLAERLSHRRGPAPLDR